MRPLRRSGARGVAARMRRWTLVGALLAVGCAVPVEHALDEAEANEVVGALERAGIGAEKAREEVAGGTAAFVVRVSRGEAGRALELLRSLGLPRDHKTGLAEMYGQPSLIPTATEERARFVKALGNDIERTLESIEGVVSARVHLVLPESDPLAVDGRPRVPAQAAVLLKTRGGMLLPYEENVRRLVAGSVPSLEPAAVAVVATAAPAWSGAQDQALVGLGPMRVAPGSRSALLGLFATLLATIAALALALLWMARRLSAAQRVLAEKNG